MSDVETLKFKISTSGQNIVTYEEIINTASNTIKHNEERIKILDDSKSVLTILKNHKMESKKEFILKTINTALGDVFDQDLRIDIEAMSSMSTGKINMKYDIVLYQNDIEMARNEKLLTNNGGGVLSFISILFKILVGYIYSDNTFFLFDESIAQVSPKYRPRLAKFLQKFCKEYDFTIVLISQTDDIDEYADVGYYLGGKLDDNNIPILTIDKILGTYPDDNYVYSKIKNFQSIVDLEFRYKGFTVIRGGNNIGKSASFRAVNAILFNTFDAKSHPRKLIKRGSSTSIEFGFFKKEEDVIKINLSFKSNKVVYEFDDLTFTGKSLAFDKIKEKVESIGFKYVNLKDTYKNFKGNLKDQTERLAMTTQHDGFYLVGNKNNETEKVFNFLFDSTAVANAIAQVSNDINNCKNLLEVATTNFNDNTFKLRYERLYYDILIHQYYTALISAHNSLLTQRNMYDIHKEIRVNIVANITGYESIVNGLNHINQLHVQLENLNNNKNAVKKNIVDDIIVNLTTLEKLNTFIYHLDEKSKADEKRKSIGDKLYGIDKVISILTELETYIYYQKSFEKHSHDILTLKSLNLARDSNISKSSIIDELVEKINIKDNVSNSINSFIVSVEKLSDLKDSHYSKLNDLSNLDKEFNIQICPTCNGTGHIQGVPHAY